METLLDFNVRVRRKYTFKPMSGNERSHEVSNFATSKSVKIAMFPHCNIHIHTWTSPDWKIDNQTDQAMTDKRWHSYITDVWISRGADCNKDHYLMAAEVRDRLSVSKQAVENFDMERFNLKKLNDEKSKNQVQISNKFVSLENMDDDDDDDDNTVGLKKVLDRK